MERIEAERPDGQGAAAGDSELDLTPFTSEAFCEGWFAGLRVIRDLDEINAAIPAESGELPPGDQYLLRQFASAGRAALLTLPGQRSAVALDLEGGTVLLIPYVGHCDLLAMAHAVRLFVTEAFLSLNSSRLICRAGHGDEPLAAVLAFYGFRHERALPNGRHLALNLDDWVMRVGPSWFRDQCKAIGREQRGMDALIRYSVIVDDWSALNKVLEDLGFASEPANH